MHEQRYGKLASEFATMDVDELAKQFGRVVKARNELAAAVRGLRLAKALGLTVREVREARA